MERNMDRQRIEEAYRRWTQMASEEDVAAELAEMGQDEKGKEDAFYRELAFGTGGLRGVIGAGTNRMNIYTVGKASQGLANYVRKHFQGKSRRIAVSYDSRIKSELFARAAAEVFAGNGIEVYLYRELMPTPCLSFAVRCLGCAAGVMVTASHNPAKYNGYKVYGADGCQITDRAAEEIQREISGVDVFDGVKREAFGRAVEYGTVSYIEEDVVTAFVEQVKAQSLEEEGVDKEIAIVYTPLNGTGLKPVLRVLREKGYTHVAVVEEQAQPDGNFPTCPYPNPEIPEAMELGVACAKKCHADLLLATDPDCDRVGIAVKNQEGRYVLLSGNETGILLLDYVCARRKALGKMPKEPVMVKTIVTTDLAERIAASYGVRCINVLTGFKYIGEQIGLLESQGREDSYIFGFEESYGYLSGTYVRDKDAVDGALMICEMFCYYRAKGKSLPQRLAELYAQYGYCLNTLHSYTFEGAEGFAKMQGIMRRLRGEIPALGPVKVMEMLDYAKGIQGLPASDVLKFVLEGGCSAVIRPSGTEPKLKAYLSVCADSREEAERIEQEICRSLEELYKG